ncbi:MAG: hypothetical protein AAF182_03865 [Pseudomonadota bacterium]
MRSLLLFLIFMPNLVFAQGFVPNTKKEGFFDLFTMSTEEITAQNLGVTEDLKKPKASVDDLLERFIGNCLNQPAERALDPMMKEFICLCSAANANENMAPEDVRTMFSVKKDARFQQERMLGLAVMPCLRKPGAHIIREQCMKDLRVTRIEEACACTATRVSEKIPKHNIVNFVDDNFPLEDLFHRVMLNYKSGYAYESTLDSCGYKFRD